MGLFQESTGLVERLDFVISIFRELRDQLSRKTGALSGRERQMVTMSRALMMGPHVLLLDEPSAGFSRVKQDEEFLKVKEINRAGVTNIMVEQNAQRCLQIRHRGYALDRGPDA